MKTKFSIIIPVYNVENYLKQCLNSLINQTYKDFEAIIICDKCSDNSEKIVDEYVKKYDNFQKIYAENTGLSLARNIGVEKSKGQYLLFLDGDDYYQENLLEVLNNSLDDSPEIIRFQVQEINKSQTIKYQEQGFPLKKGTEAFKIINKYHFIENAWCYCYQKEFWEKNNFSFKENCLAEDYGLIPLVIAKSQKVKSLSVIGYNYVTRPNSLMNNRSYEQKIKKINDMIYQSKEEKQELINITGSSQVISFLNMSLIYYITTLSKEDYKKYRQILKTDKCFNNLYHSNFKQLIKNFIIKNFTYIYYNKVVKK